MSSNDPQLLERLASCEGLIRDQARWWAARNPGVGLEDLEQEGRMGLCRAHTRFLEGKNKKFSSFAFLYIRRAMSVCVMKTRGTVRVPAHEFGRTRIATVAFDEPAALGQRKTLAEVLSAPGEADELVDADLWELLDGELKKLPPRLQAVLKGRFFEGRTLEDIGGDFHVGRERARQLQGDALKRLRKNPKLRKAVA